MKVGAGAGAESNSFGSATLVLPIAVEKCSKFRTAIVPLQGETAGLYLFLGGGGREEINFLVKFYQLDLDPLFSSLFLGTRGC